MATYKVIQDIEAEDKLLGPLTLRQFIYAGIAALCLYLSYLVIAKHVAFMVVVFLPVALTAGFFAFPWGRDQPTEIWALAKIRFLFKPRKRIWNQSGVKELVTITAPKKVETDYTNGLSQTEVKSRLKALADTIDSRGWAIKNVNVNLSNQPLVPGGSSSSDRLIDISTLPQAAPDIDVQASDDMLDEQNSPIAQHFNQMINVSEQTHRQNIAQELKRAGQGEPSQPAQQSATPPDDYWFMNQPPAGAVQPGYAAFSSDAVVAPGTSDDVQAPSSASDEQVLTQQLKAQHSQPNPAYSHLRTLQPASTTNPKSTPQAKHSSPAVTPTPTPAILDLASNNDLNVATLARQANKKTDGSDDEVVISLH